MKQNANTKIEGEKVILVPYKREHVEQYHTWMQDPALQEATASEPLTIEEEYDMQQKWAQDEDKCTFILLDRSLPDTPGTGSHRGGMAGVEADLNAFGGLIEGRIKAEKLAAAAPFTELQQGDVNFFFNDHDDHSIAEIEIMVAEPGSRRNGLATEALQLFMAYGVSALGVTRFRAKIGESNTASLTLFTSKLGYKEVSRSAVFKEVTLELPVEGEVQQRLQEAAKQLRLGTYNPLVHT